MEKYRTTLHKYSYLWHKAMKCMIFSLPTTSIAYNKFTAQIVYVKRYNIDKTLRIKIMLVLRP